MSGLAKRPLCVQCRDTAGWLYDETGLEVIVTPCPCRSGRTPEAERDAALTGVAQDHADAMRAALLIIRDTAKAQPILSANDTRARMKLAQIPGSVVGAAFTQAVKDQAIRRTGDIASTDLGTHYKPVAEYESLLYGRFGATA